MSQDRGQNDGDFGAIFARIMSAWGQKGIVGCNVMAIRNESFLLITSGLWVKVLQCCSAFAVLEVSSKKKLKKVGQKF